MDFETIILKKEEHIAIITYNRPEKMNAVNPQMFKEFEAALDDVAADYDVRVLILTGAGRAFSVGHDIEHGFGDTPENMRQGLRGHPLRGVYKVRNMEKPVIAMLNGIALGAGFEWACASDIRIGSEKFRFNIAAMELATFPGGGGLWLLPKAVGLSKAAELIFTRDWVDAQEAYRIGFLNKLVPAEELEKVTMEVARKCATAAPIAARLAKLQLNLNLQWSLREAMEFNAAAETITFTSEDHKEGLAAIREKRKPDFQGK